MLATLGFGATGFAALRLQPQPQLFQALSLGAQAPVPPSPPYGTPLRGFSANLTLAAQPVFEALLRLNPTVVGVANPSVSRVSVSSPFAAPATGPVTFSVNVAATSAITIAVGTRVQTASGTQFTVVADGSQPGYSAAQNAYVIQPGQTSATATVQASVAGTIGNVAAQSVTQFSVPGVVPSGVNVTNLASFATGADAGAQSPLLATVSGAIAAGAVTIAGKASVETPQAPVSFSLTQAPAYQTSGQDALEQSLQKVASSTLSAPQPELDHELQKSLAANVPTPQSQQYVVPSSGGAVARIVATVSQLAASAVYPAPIFSFSA